jgi:nudix-type nucleoside diphosphatase (YffH/AdpP family)
MINSPKISIEKEETLSNNWYLLKKTTFQYQTKKGEWVKLSRETYDRGNGAVILLYNSVSDKVILTRQFRFPTYVNGNPSGMLIEACAGLLDLDNPEVAIIRETEEETGFILSKVEKVMEVYMSPGSVTEKLFFYFAEYSDDMQKNDGGGVEEEEIDVLEMPFSQALEMMKTGEIKDAKTIMLLQHYQLRKMGLV